MFLIEARYELLYVVAIIKSRSESGCNYLVAGWFGWPDFWRRSPPSPIPLSAPTFQCILTGINKVVIQLPRRKVE